VFVIKRHIVALGRIQNPLWCKFCQRSDSTKENPLNVADGESKDKNETMGEAIVKKANGVVEKIQKAVKGEKDDQKAIDGNTNQDLNEFIPNATELATLVTRAGEKKVNTTEVSPSSENATMVSSPDSDSSNATTMEKGLTTPSADLGEKDTSKHSILKMMFDA